MFTSVRVTGGYGNGPMVTRRYLTIFGKVYHSGPQNDGCVCKCSFQQFCNWNEILIEMKFCELGARSLCEGDSYFAR